MERNVQKVVFYRKKLMVELDPYKDIFKLYLQS